ncbi:MAG: hypothetical protein ACOYOK_04580 [Pseudobdellovibrionaceae bacterium]
MSLLKNKLGVCKTLISISSTAGVKNQEQHQWLIEFIKKSDLSAAEAKKLEIYGQNPLDWKSAFQQLDHFYDREKVIDMCRVLLNKDDNLSLLEQKIFLEMNAIHNEKSKKIKQTLSQAGPAIIQAESRKIEFQDTFDFFKATTSNSSKTNFEPTLITHSIGTSFLKPLFKTKRQEANRYLWFRYGMAFFFIVITILHWRCIEHHYTQNNINSTCLYKSAGHCFSPRNSIYFSTFATFVFLFGRHLLLTILGCIAGVLSLLFFLVR